MKRILIGTPCRDSLTTEYVNWLLGICTQLRSHYEIIPCLSKATYVNTARNVLADKAVAEADEIVFVDADIGATVGDFLRLLSHDVDIVGADYAKRVAGEPQWTARAEPGSKPDERGLQACTCLPAGFLRVKVGVFKRLYEKLPQRRYQHEGKSPCCEYFPIGLTEKDGWRHPAEVIVDMVRDAFINMTHSGACLSEISNALDYEFVLPEVVGEDVAFCRLARAHGFQVWCDVTLKLRHYGNIGYPAQAIEI